MTNLENLKNWVKLADTYNDTKKQIQQYLDKTIPADIEISKIYDENSKDDKYDLKESSNGIEPDYAFVINFKIGPSSYIIHQFTTHTDGFEFFKSYYNEYNEEVYGISKLSNEKLNQYINACNKVLEELKNTDFSKIIETIRFIKQRNIIISNKNLGLYKNSLEIIAQTDLNCHEWGFILDNRLYLVNAYALQKDKASNFNIQDFIKDGIDLVDLRYDNLNMDLLPIVDGESFIHPKDKDEFKIVNDENKNELKIDFSLRTISFIPTMSVLYLNYHLTSNKSLKNMLLNINENNKWLVDGIKKMGSYNADYCFLYMYDVLNQDAILESYKRSNYIRYLNLLIYEIVKNKDKKEESIEALKEKLKEVLQTDYRTIDYNQIAKNYQDDVVINKPFKPKNAVFEIEQTYNKIKR